MVESTISHPRKIREKIYTCQMVGFQKQHLMFNGYNLDKSYKEVVNKFRISGAWVSAWHILWTW